MVKNEDPFPIQRRKIYKIQLSKANKREFCRLVLFMSSDPIFGQYFEKFHPGESCVQNIKNIQARNAFNHINNNFINTN